MRSVLLLLVFALPALGQDLLLNSPHGSEGELYRGQLHCHSARSDGKQTAEILLRAYGGAGYDFVALTDHLLVGADPRVNGMTWIRSSEVHTQDAEKGNGWGGHHIGALGVRTDPKTWDRASSAAVLERIAAEGGVAVANHPRLRNRWSIEQLGAAKRLHLMAIFNGRGYALGNRTIPGSGSALFSTMQQWDAALAKGHFLWGVATDDCHDVTRAADFNQGWVLVRARSRKPLDLLEALRHGDVYACRGPQGKAPALAVQAKRLEDGAWEVVAQAGDGARVRWIGKAGVVAKGAGTLRYRPRGDELYLRAEAWDPGDRDARCYGQPIQVVRKPKLTLEREDDGWLLSCDDGDGRSVRLRRALRLALQGQGTVQALGAERAGRELLIVPGVDFVRFAAKDCAGASLVPDPASGWPTVRFPD